MLFQSFAQKRIPPAVIAIILGFEAVFAAILSAIVYREAFSGRCLIGFALILAAILISEISLPKKLLTGLAAKPGKDSGKTVVKP